MEETAETNYATCITISTYTTQKEMIIPGCLAILAPLLLGKIIIKIWYVVTAGNLVV
jgi:K(+)-stimulated pyrophosphate-energized sodium pump